MKMDETKLNGIIANGITIAKLKQEIFNALIGNSYVSKPILIDRINKISIEKFEYLERISNKKDFENAIAEIKKDIVS